MPDGTSVYQLWHPVDHVDFKSSAPLGAAPLAGANFTIIEFFLTGCTPSPLVTTPTTSYTCPANQQGFLRTDSPSLWQSWPQINGSNFRVNSWSEGRGIGSMIFAAKVPRTNIDAVTITHTWSDGSRKNPGLLVTTNVRVGLATLIGRLPSPQIPGKTINEQIIKTFANGEHHIAAAWRNALHIIQEIGNLQNVIPQLRAAGIFTGTCAGA
jgi:hypothetical protein